HSFLHLFKFSALYNSKFSFNQRKILPKIYHSQYKLSVFNDIMTFRINGIKNLVIVKLKCLVIVKL
ncbi:MAG: hypothetical protein DRN30_07005, partial [Thermoplasmata archaeon]